MLKELNQLAAKIETVEGTAETLAGADAILVRNFSFKPNDQMNKRPISSSSLSKYPAVPGLRSAAIEFDVELRGSGSAGTAPEFGKLLKACGFAETVVASPASVTYLPTSLRGGTPVSVPTLTLGGYVDGILKKIWGARGDVSLKLKVGEPGLLHFAFTGADYSVTDEAMLSSGLSFQTTIPPIFANATFGIGGYSPSMNAMLENLEFKLNNKVTLRPSAHYSSGHLSAQITDREPSMSFDPEMVPVATHDFYGILRAGTEAALSLVLGSIAGNIITITAPKVQYGPINPGDRNGIETLGIDCQLNRNAGDDELSIVLT